MVIGEFLPLIRRFGFRPQPKPLPQTAPTLLRLRSSENNCFVFDKTIYPVDETHDGNIYTPSKKDYE